MKSRNLTKQCTPKFKFQAVLEALKGDKRKFVGGEEWDSETAKRRPSPYWMIL